jgi:hypothetical protein
LKHRGVDNDAIVESLRKGGPDAVTLFLQVSMDLHDFGGISAVNSWVRIALPALPETEQHALVGMLIDALAGKFNLGFRTTTIQ